MSSLTPKRFFVLSFAAIYSAATLFPPVWILITERGVVGEIPSTWFQAGEQGQYDGWGLTYVGVPGTILLWTQVTLVTTSLTGSFMRNRLVAGALHLMLTAWAVLLAGNAWWVGMHSQFAPVFIAAIIATIGLALVIARAAIRITSTSPPHRS